MWHNVNSFIYTIQFVYRLKRQLPNPPEVLWG